MSYDALARVTPWRITVYSYIHHSHITSHDIFVTMQILTPVIIQIETNSLIQIKINCFRFQVDEEDPLFFYAQGVP